MARSHGVLAALLVASLLLAVPVLAQETTSLPVPLGDGDKLVYKIDIYAKGLEGEGGATGNVEFEVALGDDYLRLVVSNIDLEEDVEGAGMAGFIFSDILELARLVSEAYYYKAAGFDVREVYATYDLPDLEKDYYKCPMLMPGKDGTVKGSSEVPLGYTSANVDYECSYKKGVLVESHLRMSGEYEGQSISAKFDARLVDSTVEGLEAGGGGLGLGLIIGIIVAVIAVVAVVAVVLLRRR